MANYELIDETNGVRYRHLGWRLLFLFILCLFNTVLVYRIWQYVYSPYYGDVLDHPEFEYDIPDSWIQRAALYSLAYQNQSTESHDFRLVKNSTFRIKYLHSDDEYGSAEENNIHIAGPNSTRVVCYYVADSSNDKYVDLPFLDIDGSLCTHINIGMAYVSNSSIEIDDSLRITLTKELPTFKEKYESIKFLLWIGGGGSASDGFPDMVKSHQSRKLFIQSLKHVLKTYKLDGCDLDWEFPSAYNRERMHFTQLLYEIRKEYIREKRPIMLSLAVAAPDGIALFAYDVAEINKYADHVNIMTYDYHFFTKNTPFTGLNSPLYARKSERSILATININYTVNWWITNGLERKKIIVGLPTYGHSFRLVNPFNTAIGAPAEGYGRTGIEGFVSAGELCWFLQNRVLSSLVFDKETCSHYASSGSEWISFEHVSSITCKVHYIKAMNLGGAMIFSLNTDDFRGICSENQRFLLTTIVHSILT